jgi:hypothetical protein
MRPVPELICCGREEEVEPFRDLTVFQNFAQFSLQSERAVT